MVSSHWFITPSQTKMCVSIVFNFISFSLGQIHEFCPSTNRLTSFHHVPYQASLDPPAQSDRRNQKVRGPDSQCESRLSLPWLSSHSHPIHPKAPLTPSRIPALIPLFVSWNGCGEPSSHGLGRLAAACERWRAVNPSLPIACQPPVSRLR